MHLTQQQVARSEQREGDQKHLPVTDSISHRTGDYRQDVDEEGNNALQDAALSVTKAKTTCARGGTHIKRGNSEETIPGYALEDFERVGNVKGARERVRWCFFIQVMRLQLPSNIACDPSISYCTSRRETPTIRDEEPMEVTDYVSERHR